MTAEIIIMNAGAVALAADSAATVTTGLGGSKVFSSDDKIFALTESAPVGIMTFGKADFMGIPFETIITEYRRRHGSQTYAHLEEYGEAFLSFLQEEIGPSIPIEKQQEFIVTNAQTLFAEIVDTIERQRSNLRTILADEDEDRAQEIWAIEEALLVRNIIVEYSRKLEEAESLEAISDGILREAEQLLEPHTDEMQGKLSELQLTAEEAEQVIQIVHGGLSIMAEEISLQSGGDYTGIVIAGFGEDDLLPAYYEYHMEGLIYGVLKVHRIEQYKIEDSNDSEIAVFAQADVIYNFLFGIHPGLLRQAQELFGEMLRDFVEEFMTNLDRYSQEERNNISFGLERSIELTADSFRQDVFGRAFDQHYGEITSVASFIPKGQLAEMAEALVSLTSLRRRVSFGDETVGGPTDVAVITKGGGLVWSKRK